MKNIYQNYKDLEFSENMEVNIIQKIKKNWIEDLLNMELKKIKKKIN
jgi:hypothetical protein